MRPPLACLLALLGLFGCDAWQPPERFINEAARPPRVETIDLGGLRPGQHVAGPLQFQLRLDTLQAPVREVVVYLDDNYIEHRAEPPYAFRIETGDFDEGEHVLAVAVYTEGFNRMGLLGLSGAPAAFFSLPLVFDPAPPEPVQDLVVTRSGTQVRLTWAPSPSANFRAYYVERWTNWGAPFDDRSNWAFTPDPSAPLIDSLFDARQTTLEEPIAPSLGAWSTYRVWTTNGVEFAASETVTAFYGTPLRYRVFPPYGVARAGGRVYAFESPEVMVVLEGQEVTRRVEIQTQLGIEFYGHSFTAEPEGNALYLHLKSGPTIDHHNAPHPVIVLDPADLTEVRRLTVPAETRRILALDEERLLAAVRGDVYVIDAQTGEQEGRLPLTWKRQGYRARMLLSPDRTALFVATRLHAHATLIERVDLTRQPFAVTATREVPAQARLYPAPDADRLLVALESGAEGGKAVEVWDAGLRKVSTLASGTAQDLVATEEAVYTLHEIWSPTSRGTSEVRRYDWSTGAQTGTWTIHGRADGVLLSPDERSLLIFVQPSSALPGVQGWAIPLDEPAPQP